MIINTRDNIANQLSNKVYDVCICGAGPAGITLARKLAEKGRQVALMEGGDRSLSSDSQQLYRGDSLGTPYPVAASRLRYFGGTSNHWGGETRPLDERDFQPLAYHPYNEWPIAKQDLDVYTAEVSKILDLDQPDLKDDVFDNKASNLPLMTPAYRYSKPVTRFGIKYGEEISESPNIHLHLNANLVDISLNNDHDEVSEFVFRYDPESQAFAIKARYFVLSCGGLENPRALLLANKQMSNGIGNRHDMVGRHFCEHIETTIGSAVMKESHESTGFNICTDVLMRSKKCLSFLVEFSATGSDENSSFLQRLYDSIFGASEPELQSEISLIIQQACNPESRVTLTDKKDEFGLKRLALNWRQTALDHHTIRTAAIEVANTLARHDIGRMKVAPFILDRSVEIPIGFMNHHMCTTRMSKDERTGVVDQDCKVFGLDNFFIAGSSVFASAGVSNPTYTIIQLALRLGGHMNELLD
ncbi:choline dehydrogenase-like flavoprotein [Roseivirga ehrenbergii]|uniref:Glucose-methanol-choline oxidoreductase C-terminal domain-containing protein n=1 Tax=Roseivirga ehrenbergii (strain DSM 102268 / JCM 13514 / KCTC 12282 / NCIMB 14502 / KMM 6017) TaxID=279360 RepID=A0A150XQL9_ROSEK|nr:GMC family oxidoreductase [Roseivirga ehrenbergii]KYG81030.1 hypothetical protein MB14_14720 [Roseivirga ehrenbergii]TCL00896.1 choline dehydrogenase-like flavoprotein [Roseivirga ehrenbergii]